MDIIEDLKSLATIDIFKQGRDSSTFVGHPFYFDYWKIRLLVNDKWKNRVGGIPAGAFLLAAYNGEPDVKEMVLLRVIGPTPLPTDTEVVASMVEYYKADLPPRGNITNRIDTFTRYEFSFSGLDCRVLGTFYCEGSRTVFGADIDNFYSAHHYSVYKPCGKVLEYIVNFREGKGIPGGPDQVRLGEVRYSASRRHLPTGDPAPVYVSALDFVGKRTALFGMTRTGKSNTVKKVIEATVELGQKDIVLNDEPLAPIGQIVFDVNGEYANTNQQDNGTAIYELFADMTTRYSLLAKPGFEVMKLNFQVDVLPGFGLLGAMLGDETADYVSSFLSISLEKPPNDDRSAITRWERVVAAYQACLFAAGYELGNNKIRFTGHKELNALAGGLNPTTGLTGDQAVTWFSRIWDAHADNNVTFFADYKNKKGRDWADEDLKAVLVMLTRKKKPGGNATVSGYRKLQPFREYHTTQSRGAFEDNIVLALRDGKIVIIDLSQGNPVVQRTYAERICKMIFSDSMQRFINNSAANYIQLYFEEAHNLFPKKEEKDLSQIYNRLAKEGAKLRLGLAYATQEVTSISSNVLKNTQNWFVSHLNNRDEIREISKYYDFEDFADSLRSTSDRGFIRMKVYSNAFIVPVQIDRFLSDRSKEN